jgi:HD-like signal output (HDOD) protein
MTPQELVQEVGSLFTLPDAALRLNELMEDPQATLQDLAEVVQMDAGLAAAVLRMANSAYYGLPAKVGSIPMAINLIGQRALRSIVLSVSITRAFKGLPAELVDMQAFWENSTACGAIARALARRARTGNADDLFLAGLLHAVGRLVFYARRPVHYREILRPGMSGQALAAEERLVFGFDHAELGAALLAAWRLPPLPVTAVAYQLRPLQAPAFIGEVAMLHVAQDMAAGMAPQLKTNGPPSDYRPSFDPAVGTRLGLDPVILPEIRQEALLDAVEILEIVNPRASLIY